MFCVNESTVKRWTNSGKLRCLRTLGGHRRYTPDRILEFIETFKYEIPSLDSEATLLKKKPGGNMLDFLLLKKDYHTLREVYFADALKGDSENLTRLLVDCSSKADTPLTVIYNEIVSKAINKIKNLGRQQKLNRQQQEEAIGVILESFVRLRDVVQTQR